MSEANQSWWLNRNVVKGIFLVITLNLGPHINYSSKKDAKNLLVSMFVVHKR